MDSLTKTKQYNAKFPRNVIEDALRIFLEEAQIPNTQEASFIYAAVEEAGESWQLPSIGEFLSEYGKTITRARLNLSWSKDSSRIQFWIRFSVSRNGACTSEIDITHLSRSSIERVFKVFQDFSIQKTPANRVSTYQLERQLPSCHVTLQLLKKLEQLILANGAHALGSQAQSASSIVEIRLSDSRANSSGCEILTTIDNYQREYFSNTIKRAQISLGSLHSDAILIQFDRERIFTVLKLSMHSPTARADAINFADQVLEIVNDHKNGNWFLNPPLPLKFFLEIVSYISISIGISFARQSTLLFLGPLATAAGLQVYTNLHRLKPYSEFHSRQSELISKWFNWFVFALVELILLAPLTTILRNVYSWLSGS